MEIKDKVAIVTGASYGIGLATARLLSEKGAKLTLAARSKNKLQHLAKQLPNSIPITTDMTKTKEIENMVKQTIKQFGKVDILVNNAGQGYDVLVEQIDINKIHYILDLDLIGPIVTMQQVIPYMRKQGAGSIINISSGLALMNLPSMGAYSCIKQALAHLSLTAREELKKDNITISVVYPYSTLTDFEKNTIQASIENTNFEENSDNERRPPPDSAEYIAEKIVTCIESGEAEVFAHDWMKKLKHS